MDKGNIYAKIEQHMAVSHPATHAHAYIAVFHSTKIKHFGFLPFSLKYTA